MLKNVFRDFITLSTILKLHNVVSELCNFTECTEQIVLLMWVHVWIWSYNVFTMKPDQSHSDTYKDMYMFWTTSKIPLLIGNKLEQATQCTLKLPVLLNSAFFKIGLF